MRVFRSIADFPKEQSFSACALGLFDGVHVGHKMVLEAALRRAKSDGLQSVVLTFANHPQSVLSKTPTELLTTLDERLERFEAMGFDAVFAPDFNETMQNMTASQFIDDLLCEQLQARYVSVGYDHRFGKGREGDGEFLKAAGKTHGFDVDIIDPVSVGKQIVSSTLIRKLLTYGDAEQAAALLGRPYSIRGTVVHGKGRGRSIGIPTANLLEDEHRLLPANGVYAGKVTLISDRLANTTLRARLLDSQQVFTAVCNVGIAPTFEGEHRRQLEAHLFGFDADLYDARIEFTFLKHLRGEIKFPTVDALIAQIQQDCSEAKQVL